MRVKRPAANPPERAIRGPDRAGRREGGWEAYVNTQVPGTFTFKLR